MAIIGNGTESVDNLVSFKDSEGKSQWLFDGFLLCGETNPGKYFSRKAIVSRLEASAQSAFSEIGDGQKLQLFIQIPGGADSVRFSRKAQKSFSRLKSERLELSGFIRQGVPGPGVRELFTTADSASVIAQIKARNEDFTAEFGRFLYEIGPGFAACRDTLSSWISSRPIRKVPEDHKVALIAHRGWWLSPEAGKGTNSIASINAAGKLGIWGTEFDMNMTSDNVVLVFHDNCIGDKKISMYPYSEFKDHRIENGEKIPTIEEYLDEALKYPKLTLVIEFKWLSGSAQEIYCINYTINELKKRGLYDPQRVIFISFSRTCCTHLVRVAKGFTVQFLDKHEPSFALKMGCNGLDTHYSYYLAEPWRIDFARANGMSVNTWCPDWDLEIKRIIALGVDQLTTNIPDVARKCLADLEVEEFKQSDK
ncbi:MAG: hypothetical protein MJY62_00545 [Bacteroidales bacterium]|nr:hypothetical protein [Bacteroidales bacterium]